MIRTLAIGIAFAALVAAIVVVKTHHHTATAAPGSSSAPPDPADAYSAKCAQNSGTAECATLRAAVTANVLDALETLRDAHDERGVEVALDALTLDQPAIQEVALQILGAAASRDDIVAAVVPVFLGPHPALQQLGADVLASASDSRLGAIADQWKRGHPSTSPSSPYELDDERTMPAVATSFAAYPRATRYPPADSANSIGWRTTDPVDKVLAFYARGAKGDAVDARTWAGRARAGTPTGDPSQDPDVQQIQKLAEEYGRTHDPQALAKMKALQQQLKARAQGQATTAKNSVYGAPGPTGDAADTFRAVVVEGDAGHALRAVAVYREDAIKATIVQEMWDTSSYPGW